jgi:hypothetical protein
MTPKWPKFKRSKLGKTRAPWWNIPARLRLRREHKR